MISPLFHAASLGMGALPVILKGATIVLEKGFEPGRALELIERHGVTMLSGVPTTYQLLADHPRVGEHRPRAPCRSSRAAGSAVPTRILNAYEERGLSFSQGYGMTETSPGATSLSPGDDARQAGQRRPAALLHRRAHRRRARGDGAARHGGRDRDHRARTSSRATTTCPRPPRRRSSPDGWFRSGDMGYLDPDGYLYIADRLKDMIISGGENIYPAEIENLISDIDGVTGVAVIGVPRRHVGRGAVGGAHGARGRPVTPTIVRARLDGTDRALQAPEERRRHRRAAADGIREGAQGRPAGAVRGAERRTSRAIASNCGGGCRIAIACASASRPRTTGRPASPLRGSAAAGEDRPAAGRASRRRASCGAARSLPASASAEASPTSR